MARPSGSSPGTEAPPRTVVLVELHDRSTCTDVRLTFSPAAVRWIKRLLVAQLALDTAALVGSSTWTYVRGLL